MCNNTYKNITNIKFYNFPNRAYEKKTKELWIKAVNRVELVNENIRIIRIL
jgi:hypothetical protein